MKYSSVHAAKKYTKAPDHVLMYCNCDGAHIVNFCGCLFYLHIFSITLSNKRQEAKSSMPSCRATNNQLNHFIISHLDQSSNSPMNYSKVVKNNLIFIPNTNKVNILEILTLFTNLLTSLTSDQNQKTVLTGTTNYFISILIILNE